MEKFFVIIAPPPLTYSYSRLAWPYIHKRSWHNKWVLYLGGGGGGATTFTTFGTLGRGDEGDTKLEYFTFDLFTLSINIH